MYTRFLRRLRGPLLGAAAAALVLVSAEALAGSGVGAVFNLGTTNSVDALSALTGTVAGDAQLRVDNASTAANSFGVFGRVTTNASGSGSAGVRGLNQTTGSNGFGVIGIHNGTGIGVSGQSGQGTGVFGRHSAASGTNPGVQGNTDSQTVDAAGVLGKSTTGAPGTSGVRGVAAGEADGVLGVETAGFGSGVHGIGPDHGLGVFGEASGGGTGVGGVGATGIFGSSFDTIINGVGVHGTSSSPGGDAAGVLGEQLSPTSDPQSSGVFGRNEGAGSGVSGSSTGGTGGVFTGLLAGLSASAGGATSVGVSATSNGGAGIGVYAEAAGGGGIGIQAFGTSLAGEFDGDVHVTGKITKDYKSGGPPNLAIPIAYGSVKADGTLNSGTPNVTTSISGSTYVIAIAGETYTTTGYVTVITPSGGTAVSGRTLAASGKLEVRMFTAAGSNTTAPFSFITYKP